jgi:hypothetical protein
MSIVALAELALEVWAAAAVACIFLCIFRPSNIQAAKAE